MADIDLLQRLNAIVWEADAATLRFSFVTQVAHTLLGFPVDDWIADEGFLASHSHPDDRAVLIGACRDCARDGGDRQLDHRMLGADGRACWFRTVVHGLREGDGPVVGLLGLMVDVTEQKKTEAAMHAAEERVRTVVNNAPIMLMACDEDGVFTLSEGRGLDLLGIRPGALVGRSIFEVFAGEPHLHATFRRALSGEDFTSVDEIRAHGRWWETRWAPLRADGRVVGTTGVATHITDRVRAEEERAWLLEASRMLAGSFEYERTLAEIARLSVPVFADWVTVDLLEGALVRRLAVVHCDPEKAWIAAKLEQLPPRLDEERGPALALRTGQPWLVSDASDPVEGLTPERLALVRALGVRSYMAVPMTAHGQTLGVISFAATHERRRFGPVELGLAQDLAGRAALAIENARLYRTSQEEVRLRDEFLSVASHELRTPVTSLQLAVQSLMEFGTSPPIDFLANALRSAERSSRRLGKLVDALLDVSRIQAGKLALEREELDLAQLARDTAASLEKELTRAGCALTVSADARVVGRWDRGRLEQVITNLLTNTIKYAAGKPVELSVVREGGLARLSVRDQGIGIASDELNRIFGRFERAVPERHYGGLGLGLYIVRRILEAHGGTIRVESQLGVGSIFIAELPLAAT
jgi:PAS domain S-box-containing protein